MLVMTERNPDSLGRVRRKRFREPNPNEPEGARDEAGFPKPVEPPPGYLTLAQAVDFLGVDDPRQRQMRRWINQVDAETGERRLPAEWVPDPVRSFSKGGYYLIKAEDLILFAAKKRSPGGGTQGARGNARRWVHSPIR